MPAHIALLGDSILDNAGYTGGSPDVAAHLRRLVAPHEVTLLARDGSTTTDLAAQVARMPGGVTHAFISIGGNDGLLEIDVLRGVVSSVAEAVTLISGRAWAFEDRYRAAVGSVVERVERVALCTIYQPRLDGAENELVRAGLVVLNDVILRTAIELGLPVIDLRFVMTDAADFANPLEPSSSGGAKIASAIAGGIGFRTPSRPATTVTSG